jgi:pyruvate kinase
MRHEAIYATHPNVVSIDDTAGAFDANGNAVVIDEALVEAEVERLIAEEPAKEARAKRDRLLADSDWVTIRATDTGNPVPTEWQTYRQALRDITEQTGFPENIEWPQEPTA